MPIPSRFYGIKFFFFAVAAVFLSYLCCTFSAHACPPGEAVELLRLNHPDSTKEVVYTFRQEVVSGKIHTISAGPTIDQDFNFLEKFYFSPEITTINSQELYLEWKNLRNLQVHFKWKEEQSAIRSSHVCSVARTLIWKGEEYELLSVDLSYHQHLGIPTLQDVRFKVKTSSQQITEIKIEDWQAQAYGYIPFYEFHLGIALNTHSNIRPNETRPQNRHDPVREWIPSFLFRYGPLFINKDGAGTVLVPLENFLLLATFLKEGEPYRAPGLRERKESIYFGPLLKVKDFDLIYYSDIRGISSGNVIKLNYGPEWKWAPSWQFSTKVFYQFWDKKYVDYYFGVNEQEARNIGRSSFRGRRTFNYGFMLEGQYRYKKLKYLATTGIKFYGSEVYRSPIVTKKQEVRFVLGVVYQFL